MGNEVIINSIGPGITYLVSMSLYPQVSYPDENALQPSLGVNFHLVVTRRTQKLCDRSYSLDHKQPSCQFDQRTDPRGQQLHRHVKIADNFYSEYTNGPLHVTHVQLGRITSNCANVLISWAGSHLTTSSLGPHLPKTLAQGYERSQLQSTQSIC
jgi:hypothetical protein